LLQTEALLHPQARSIQNSLRPRGLRPPKSPALSLKSATRTGHPAGAEARFSFGSSARLKPCPDTELWVARAGTPAPPSRIQTAATPRAASPFSRFRDVGSEAELGQGGALAPTRARALPRGLKPTSFVLNAGLKARSTESGGWPGQVLVWVEWALVESRLFRRQGSFDCGMPSLGEGIPSLRMTVFWGWAAGGSVGPTRFAVPEGAFCGAGCVMPEGMT